MAIDNHLIDTLANAMNSNNYKESPGTYLVGTVVETEGEKTVMFGDSGESTPVLEGVDARPGDTVMVYIKNHTATVTNNMTAPASGYVATELEGTVNSIGEDVDAVKDDVSRVETDLEAFMRTYEESSAAFLDEYNQYKDEIAQKLESTKGFYETLVTNPDGTQIKYVHDAKTIDSSSQVWKYTADAIAMSIDGGATYPYGFSVDGNMIMSKISAEDINALGITAKDIYVGPNKETFIAANGGFQFGGTNGIKYNPGTKKVTFGSDVIITWDDVSGTEDVASKSDLNGYATDADLEGLVSTTDLDTALRPYQKSVNLITKPDLRYWDKESSNVGISYDSDFDSFLINCYNSTSFYGITLDMVLEADAQYVLSFETRYKLGVTCFVSESQSTSHNAGNYYDAGVHSKHISIESPNKYLRIYLYCSGNDTCDVRNLGLYKVTIAEDDPVTKITTISKSEIATSTIRCDQLQADDTISGVNLVVGSNQQTKILADGTLQLGGPNGITFNPTNSVMRLGSNVSITWDSLPTDVVSGDFLDETLDGFADDKADKSYVDSELNKKANKSDLDSKANVTDIVNPNLLNPADLLEWPHENSALVGYDIETGCYTIKVKSSYYGAYISIPIEHDVSYTLSGYATERAGINYSFTESAQNLTSAGVRTFDPNTFVFTGGSNKSNYLNIYVFCRYDSSSVDANGYTTAYIKNLKLEKGSIATPFEQPTNPRVITEITKNTVTTEYVNALNVTAKTVSADWVYAGAVQASQVKADDLSAISAKIGGFVIAQNYLETEKYITNKTDNNNYTERYGRLNPIRNGADTNAFLIVKERKVTAGNSSTNTKFKVDYDGNVTASSLTAMQFNPDFLFGIDGSDWIDFYDSWAYGEVPTASSDNLNNIKTGGVYAVTSGTTGYPSDQSNSGRLEVKWLNTAGTRIRQVLYPVSASCIRYERNWNGSSWSSWVKFAPNTSTSNITVSSVTAKS